MNGYATITDFSDNENYMYAIADLTKIYEGQAKEVKRGVAIVDSHYAVVRDEVKTLGQPTVIRWNMVTEAQPAIIGEHTIQLSQNGRKTVIGGGISGKGQNENLECDITQQLGCQKSGCDVRWV